jgi:hypothetical protein
MYKSKPRNDLFRRSYFAPPQGHSSVCFTSVCLLTKFLRFFYFSLQGTTSISFYRTHRGRTFSRKILFHKTTPAELAGCVVVLVTGLHILDAGAVHDDEGSLAMLYFQSCLGVDAGGETAQFGWQAHCLDLEHGDRVGAWCGGK